WYAVMNRRLEAVIDDAFGCRDFGRLLGSQCALPAEHLCLERTAVVERQDVKRLVVTNRGHAFSLNFLYQRIRLLVELSCASWGSSLLSSSGIMRLASTFPSSTPH